jgi:hypothetical protein
MSRTQVDASFNNVKLQFNIIEVKGLGSFVPDHVWFADLATD